MQPNTMSTTILMLIAMMSQSFLLCTLLHKIILLPLEEEATQMESWDPTEIIALPIHSSILRNFVLIAFGCSSLIYSAVIVISVSVVGELSSVRRRPHGTLPTAINCITVVGMWNFAAFTLTFLVSVLCGVTPTKSTILPSLWGCTYLSSVAFTPLILCLSYCYFCSCRCSIDFTSQLTEHFHFAELLLYQIVTEYLSTRNNRETQFDDHDATSKLMEPRPTKYWTTPYLTQESFHDCSNTSSQTRHSSVRTSSRSVENPLSVDDQPLYSLLQQIFCYYLVPNAIATLCGTSIFSILSILDWGSQIQRWPVPMILGATVGHVFGTAYVVLGFVRCTVFSSNSTTNAQLSYHPNTVVSSKME